MERGCYVKVTARRNVEEKVNADGNGGERGEGIYREVKWKYGLTLSVCDVIAVCSDKMTACASAL